MDSTTNNINDLIWEESPCAWCGSTESHVLFQGPDRLERLPGMFTIVRCQQCGILRQNPRLNWSSLKEYYPETYVSHDRLIKDEPTKLRRLDKRYGPWKRFKAISHYINSGRMLEVGCGTGQFLEEVLRSNRWDVVGIEPSERAASYVRSELGIPVYQSLFSEVDLPPKSFDVIAMWNVLEHLPNPIDDLRYAQRLLKDNGWLVTAIPNLEGLGAKVFGKYWVGWDLPRHLYFLPRKTFYEILESMDFHVAGARCISTSYSVLGHSVDFWTQSWEQDHPDLKNLVMRSYYSFFVRAGLIFPLAILDRLNLSTIITIFAQKKT